MTTFRNQEGLKDNKYQIISIDGKDGSGKSTLAKYLAEKLNIHHIKLYEERYLIKNKGKYVDYIKYDVLKSDISELLSQKRIIILDGE